MPENRFVDYYELLQISPNAEEETIHRVYKMLASRYHPDNPETGDVEMFLLLKRAVAELTDPQTRSRYDTSLRTQQTQPIKLFSLREFAKGIDGESNRRMGVLCLLYNRRRTTGEDPGYSILDLENMMACPREHLMFALWYLKEKGLVRQDDRSNFLITGEGVDHVEANLPQHKLLYKLLKASETGGSWNGKPEKRAVDTEEDAQPDPASQKAN